MTNSNPDSAREFDREEFEAQERLVLDVTEMLYEAMERRNVSQADWARLLSVTEGELSQRLSGRRNLTLRSLAQMLHKLQYGIQVGLVDRLHRNRTYFARNYEKEFEHEVGGYVTHQRLEGAGTSENLLIHTAIGPFSSARDALAEAK
jgi:transcriptional regulator with XRE-family HTH domain